MTAVSLIALYSPAPGSGKSTVAEHLVEQHGFTAIKFAGPLKDMVRVLLFDHCGINHTMTERYVDGDLKEQIIPELGVTSRHLQQQLGTNWGRKLIRDDLWVHIARQAVELELVGGCSVVIDDMRFTNEMEAVLDLGGLPLRIDRPGLDYVPSHASEGGLDEIPMQTITNDDSVAALHLAVDRLLGYA